MNSSADRPRLSDCRFFHCRKIWQICSAVIFAICYLVPVKAEGEFSTLPADPLTLDKAVTFALDNNLALRIARSNIKESSGALSHANRSVPGNPELEIATGFRNRPGDDSVDIGIRIAQEFWIAGQGELQQGAAGNRLSAIEAEYAYLQTTIAARVRRAFLDILWALESRDTAQRTYQLAISLEGYARQRLKAGEITRLDLNTARLGSARARNALEKAKLSVVQARIRLAKLLSINPVQLPTVTGQLNLEPVELPDNQSLVNQAVLRRQDIAAAAQNIMAARKDLELARRQIIPNLTVFGFFDREGGEENIPGIGISLPLPLFHRFEGETQQAAARLEHSQAVRDELFISTRNDLILAVSEYNAAGERVNIIGDRMFDIAEENVQLAQEAFRAGKVGAPALTTAQDSLLNVRDEYLEALRDLITAGVDLERVTGGLVFLSGSENTGHKDPAKDHNKTGDGKYE